MDAEKVAAHITEWLKEYAQNAGVDGFVIGISGGIDSAVTSTLAAKTGRPTLCVEMPIHQNESQEKRGRAHIKWLEENYQKVASVKTDLTSVFDSFINEMPEAPDSENRQMALVNTRARLRMTALYYFAGLQNRLVVGTGNKVEDFGIGFFTKYGDGGVDLSPIADLTKTQVWALGTYLNINEEIQNAAPTDGLWGDDRTDEDQIGASYPELEWAMRENEKGSRLTDFEGREREIFKIFSDYYKANQHKMKPIPVCKIPKDLLV